MDEPRTSDLSVWACSCGYEDSFVYESRPHINGHIRRRRKCSECGRRWSTVEVSEAVFRRLLAIERAVGELNKVTGSGIVSNHVQD